MATKQVTKGKAPPAPPPRRPAPPPARQTRPAQAEPKNAKESRALVTTAASDLPDEISEMMSEDAGDGLSTDQADNLVPLIYVLQPLSPQAMRGNEDEIEGAAPGHIWLRNANADDQLQAEIDFQPVYFWKDWVEWVPRTRGGGRGATFADKPANAFQQADPENPQSMKWKLPNGNDLVETRYYAGLVHLEDGRKLAYILPLSSTGHTVGKDMMTKMNNQRNKVGDKVPLYGNKLHLKTKVRSNNKGEWYVFEVADLQFITDKEEYLAGKQLCQSFRSGEKKADESQMNDAGRDPRDNDGSM